MNEPRRPGPGLPPDLASLSADDRRALLHRLLARPDAAPRVVPMSFAQERLWFLDQLVPGNPFYNVDAAIRLRGTLDAPALERSLLTISARHETLRTTFGSVEGRPTQFVHPRPDLRLTRLDLRHFGADQRLEATLQAIRDEARRPFDLSRGPVVRATLLALAANDHVLLLTLHHIVSDGWSMGVLVSELAALYNAYRAGQPSPLPPLPIQYGDYAQWQRQRLTGEALRSKIAYWTRQLASLPHLELPTDRQRPAVPTFEGRRSHFSIPDHVAHGLRTLSREQGTTLFMTLLAAFQVLLHRDSGQDDIVVGTPIAGRTRGELEPLIGFFVNTLVLRTSLAGRPTFRSLLERVRDHALDAFAHQDLPFERLVEELHPDRDLSRNPLCQVVFALQNAPTSALALDGLDVSYPSVSNDTTRFDLVLDVWESPRDAALEARLEYSHALFDAPTIAAMGHRFVALLDAVVTTPDRPIDELPVLTESDRETLLIAWNDTARDLTGTEAVHVQVARRAAESPERLAVSDDAVNITYGALDLRARRLARELRRFGAGPDRFVAVCFEPSVQWVVALLAVLKTGAAYVALDPTYPADRLRYMLDTAAPTALVTRGALVAAFEGTVTAIVDVDEAECDHGPRADEDLPHQPETMDMSAIAYVIFTSGSTGTPNGVAVPHRGLGNLVAWHRQTYAVTHEDRASQVAGPGFDASVWEVWPYLTAGASLHIAPPAVRFDPPAVAQWLADAAITLSFLPTPLAEAVLAGRLPERLALRVMLTGGDRLRRAPQRPLPFRLVNHYGPTEYSVVATAAEVPSVDPAAPEADAAPPIGRPIANTRVYVLDANGGLAPPRVPGQLAIAGMGLARGYLRRDALTDERFVPDPFSPVVPAPSSADGRMYLTGDRVRWRHDGQLESLGRMDTQVSVRGFRVELAEIEAALGAHPAVQSAVVLARDDGNGDPRLTAYIVRSDEDRRHDAETARERVDTWQALYDTTYAASAPADPRFDITGWHSSYTGLPLPEADMREWADHTAARIAARAPARILEIGVGTGLLLFRLAPQCERYLGVDFSTVAIDTLSARVPAADLPQVELRHAQADALDDIEPGGFDAVILNSIVQYFPGADHLLAVLDKAVSLLALGGFVFVGDVRSLPLQHTFHTSVELHRAPATMTVAQFRNRVRAAVLREEELLVAPALFVASIEHPKAHDVRVLMKRGRHHNELTAFRYDVFIDTSPPSASPHDDRGGWLDWDADALSVAVVTALLRDEGPEVLELRHVPNARLRREARALALLAAAAPTETVGSLRESLLASDASGSDDRGGVDLDTFANRAAGCGYDVEPSWTDHGADGRFDLRLRRTSRAASPAAPGERRTLRRVRPFPSETPTAPPRGSRTRERLRHTNDPLQFSIGRRLIPEIRRAIRSRLPEHMMPAAFVFLDAFPLTPNGKIDREALPDPAISRDGVDGEFVAPRTPIEEVIAGFWAELLGSAAVGVRDNFFELGGHSLLGMQLVARLRDAFHVDLPITRLFDAPTVEGLAAALIEHAPARADLEQRAVWTLTVSRMSDEEVARHLQEGTAR